MLPMVPQVSEHSLNPMDLRLFHHFLLYAHPHLPLGSDSTWTTDVPRRASEHPHLMHAILSLSAEHLGSYDKTIASLLPLQHRQKALTWLSETLSAKQELSESELELVTDVSMALMFQTAYMENGFYDFMKILRGTGALGLEKLRMYNNVGPTSYTITHAKANELFQSIPIDCRIPQAAIQSLLGSTHLYQTDGPLRDLYQMEISAANALQRMPWEGYMAMWNLFMLLTLQSAEDSARVLDRQDPLAKILQAHLLGLSVVTTPLRLYELGERAKYHPNESIIAWIEGICHSMGATFLQYVRWPLRLCDAVQDRGKNTPISAANLAALVLERPELFR